MSGAEQGIRAGKSPQLDTEKARRAARHPDRPEKNAGRSPARFFHASIVIRAKERKIALRSAPTMFLRSGESTTKISPDFHF
jgi:hypothetical protein